MISSSTLSIGKVIATIVDWLNVNYSGIFNLVDTVLSVSVSFLEKVLLYPSPFLVMIILGIIAWRTAGKGMAVFTLLGLFFGSYYLNMWNQTMLTIALVGVSTVVALFIAIPIGILSAVSNRVNHVTRPLMDIMQTMPAWVYLIPAVILFSLGRTPALIATVVFAIPPPLRLTNLGIRQVPIEYVEAGKAFGATNWQILRKIQMPAALPTIMAGINQCLMLSLSMVVLAGLIGAGGLGGEVVVALTRLKIGSGVRAGLAIVILAIIFDRITQGSIQLFGKGYGSRASFTA